MLKRIAAATGSALLLLALFVAPVAASNPNVDVNGSFTVDGAAITVTAPGTMTPLLSQTVTVHVDMGTGNALTEVTGITFKVWYDADGGATNQTEFASQSADTQTCAVITWAPSTFSLTAMSGTSWVLGACSTPTLTNQAGDFTFVFTPGKVASEAHSPAAWQSAALVSTTDYGSAFASAGTPSDMNQYQQLTISGSPTLSWSAVTQGMAFSDTASQVALGQPITIISNSDYDLDGQSTATWTTEGGINTATLDPTGAVSLPQQFALEVDNATTNGSAILLHSTATQIKSGSITGESGFSYSAINIWLKLASTFTPDTYSGTVNFSVANPA